ncbi:alpha-glucuronidase family glycosyl hydrolase [Sphingomonas sp.]|uniref:alpha-glucuronidase family glycosyl hydrolase n=1 Tax=Sphingomonas sp. TaxID=28214 RepID=UPI002B71FF4D|nr:alpha-glucuronidase family glycosyl hydrolase [Sphingomonas sp.]HTG39065.1 alpha-glucuronidase family glycosyl hydrolase [Sphingomonas sp.]
MAAMVAALTILVWPNAAAADDGYRLWMRYDALPAPQGAALAARAATVESDEAADPTIAAAIAELRRALPSMTGRPMGQAGARAAILVGTPKSQRIAALKLDLSRAGDEGFVIRETQVGGRPMIVIAGNRPVGALYGAFHLLRLAQAGTLPDRLDVVERPRVKLRMLNHWDNLDRTVERGFSGQSIWDWWKLPTATDPRYVDYARANASLGINGTVLNNVNAKPDTLTAEWIAKAAAVADVLRPYGIKVYLSARWSTPVELKQTRTADPLDPEVAAWWKAKADEIYRAIPDFGGFLVKANSEGQPGPQDYKRTHADGANMLAAAVKPHGGIVMWRAFVYSEVDPEDRAKQAYSEFKPLDGTFADNVIVQVKNGPIDFQPREPFHPLFGAMPKTPLVMEVQITKEYLGFATHLAYLAPMWTEVLAADTHAKGKGSTVAKVIDGSLDGHELTGMAGVANIGSDRNWSGSIFDQANWYAYGRLAWNPDLAADTIATEWARQTFTRDPAFVRPVVGMMMGSRQAVVDYMTPLGLTHLMATGHHYGPGPWVDDLARPEWNPVYYHRADRDGIGFDRTRTGSNAVAQYADPVARRFADRETVGDDLLLWFHHVGWDEKLESGRTVWEELVARYDRGVAAVDAMQADWARLAPMIDAERARAITQFLVIQKQEAIWWRDASIAYFQSVSGRSLPAGVRPPAHDLEFYKAIRHPYAPGHH